MRLFVNKNLFKNVSDLGEEKDFTALEKYPTLVDFIQRSIVFENDIEIEIQNKKVKLLPFQLLCRKGTGDTAWTRLRIIMKPEMVAPSVMNCQKFSLSVLNNDSLSSDEKKEQKRLFENSQYTKESIGNPYSNMIPVLKYDEVKKIIAKRQHNRKKTEEEKMKEKKTKPAPNPSLMKNFKKLSNLPTNSEVFYLNAPYIGKPRAKRKVSTKKKTGSRKKRQKIQHENVPITSNRTTMTPKKFNHIAVAIPPPETTQTPPKKHKKRKKKSKQSLLTDFIGSQNINKNFKTPRKNPRRSSRLTPNFLDLNLRGRNL